MTLSVSAVPGFHQQPQPVRFGWVPLSLDHNLTVSDMLRESDQQVSRWYSRSQDGLAGFKRPVLTTPYQRQLFDVVQSLQTAVNRQNFILKALVNRQPGILDVKI
jgi:hypothetical protein